MEAVSDEVLQRAIEDFAPLRGRGLIVNLLAFSRVLKAAGLKIGLSQVIDAGRCLAHTEIGNRADFHAALRANLASSHAELGVFDRAFELFWRFEGPQGADLEPLETAAAGSEARDAEAGEGEQALGWEASDDDATAESGAEVSLPTYSAQELLSRKDFSEMGVEESRAISRAILLIANRIATQVSRRKKRASRGSEIDPRWSLRRSIRYGGEMLELGYRRRRVKKTRIVLLCDVSGSMDCYSRFLIQFMYGLQNELWGVETFVFSTALTRITHLIRTKHIESALERISETVLGWSGGTNIGGSLQTFNREFAPSLVTHRTVVVIISDGWDRGDAALLEREMRSLKRRSHKIIWLNPLLASENYEPLCKGMRAAMPHLDLFLPVHNLSSLLDLGRKLEKLAA
ncbi:MAG TPA: VWA domain-containing protein [Candidatus Acidoferrales bacterium]|nr:VWA domain-containing protein [Candidatus Acidoferrales bacterium]